VQTLAQWQASTGQDAHSLVATPSQLFVNPTGNDYHLSATSPALDRGTLQFAPSADFEGTARPAGNGVDIGADERGGGTTPPENQPPTDVLLSSNTVLENSAANTVIGALSAVDPDAGNTHTFTLVNNAGGRFALSGSQLVVANASLLNYEAATSHTIVVRATDGGGLSVDKSLLVTMQNVNEVVGFDVQRGAQQRSYIRYLDLVFESGDGLGDLVAEGRIGLTQYGLSGAGGAAVSLAGKLAAAGNRIAIDFGAAGLGGNRESAIGDGYYGLRIDADDNGSFETVRNFYRLLGDTNGDRIVDARDQLNVLLAFRRQGANLDADVNGSGAVNATDFLIATRQRGRRIAAGLPLDD
jgi:hypothetical protein